MLVLLFTCLVVDVSQRVKLVGHDVDVVAADTVTLAGNALALIHTRDGVELTAADLALTGVEVVGNGVDTCGITDEDNAVCQLFRLQVQVEARAVTIDD